MSNPYSLRAFSVNWFTEGFDIIKDMDEIIARPINGRVAGAFAHRVPDRTPLFEIFQPYHPIYWDICGRTVATDAALAWDAKADGIAWDELVEAEAQAQFQICKFFGLDMVRLNDTPPREYPRPVKIDKTSWMLDGVRYVLNERTKLVEIANPSESDSYSNKTSEDELRKKIEAWDSEALVVAEDSDPVLRRVRELAAAEGIDWVYMGEVGAGTAAAFYPPFMLMWMIEEPQLYLRWLGMSKAAAFSVTRQKIADGCSVIAMGGDVSCDKGPFVSPRIYHEFILPVIQEHVKLIHDAGALAVYTSDGNHWPIKDDFFFNSGVDGYKEVDKDAGMTWPRLIEEGVDKRVCIIGNINARYTLCQAMAEEVKKEVLECLEFGQRSPGGHILHASHSVHEDVKVENYYAVVEAYREFFGLKKLDR